MSHGTHSLRPWRGRETRIASWPPLLAVHRKFEFQPDPSAAHYSSSHIVIGPIARWVVRDACAWTAHRTRECRLHLAYTCSAALIDFPNGAKRAQRRSGCAGRAVLHKKYQFRRPVRHGRVRVVVVAASAAPPLSSGPAWHTYSRPSSPSGSSSVAVSTTSITGNYYYTLFSYGKLILPHGLVLTSRTVFASEMGPDNRTPIVVGSIFFFLRLHH